MSNEQMKKYKQPRTPTNFAMAFKASLARFQLVEPKNILKFNYKNCYKN